MSRYRVQYSDEATDALKRMTPARRLRFGQEIAAVAATPHRYGRALDNSGDYREAVLAGAVTVYWISDSVLVVSVVRIVHTD